MKKLIFTLTAFILTANLLCTGLPAEAAAQGINVPVPSQEEIKAYTQAHPFDIYEDTVYDTAPSQSEPGVLSESSKTRALNTINVMRYISGLDEVVIDEAYQKQDEAAVWLFDLNHGMAHSPQKPDGVSDELYQTAQNGANGSDIGFGYDSLPDAVLTGWMWDGGVSTLGHRRWCQNPGFTRTGFGYQNGYAAMYVTGQGAYNSKGITGISWPAQNMPVEYFSAGVDWSIIMDTPLNSSDITVKLERTTDGRIWNFSETASDGIFIVDNTDYLGEGCIIFNPDDITDYADGDNYTVTITGLSEPVSYTVDFFSLDSVQETETETSDVIVYMPGDVTQDNEISVADVILLQKYLLGMESLNYEQYLAADMTDDDLVNIYDLIALKKYLLD